MNINWDLVITIKNVSMLNVIFGAILVILLTINTLNIIKESKEYIQLRKRLGVLQETLKDIETLEKEVANDKK